MRKEEKRSIFTKEKLKTNGRIPVHRLFGCPKSSVITVLRPRKRKYNLLSILKHYNHLKKTNKLDFVTIIVS